MTSHTAGCVEAAVLNVWRHIRNPTPSIDAFSVKEQSCQISSWSDLKQRSLRFSGSSRPTKTRASRRKRSRTRWV